MREQFDRPRMRQLHVRFRAGQHIDAVRRRSVIDRCRRCNRLGNVQHCATASAGFRGPAGTTCCGRRSQPHSSTALSCRASSPGSKSVTIRGVAYSPAASSRADRRPAQASCVAPLRRTPRSARVEPPSRSWDCKVYCSDLIWLDRAGHVGEYHASATGLPNPIRCCARACRETSSARTWHLRITQVMPPRLRLQDPLEST